MNKPIVSIIIKFGLTVIVFLMAIARIGMGYVPSSRVVKYGNITAEGNSVSFWITIACLLMVSAVFFLLGSWSVIKYMRSK